MSGRYCILWVIRPCRGGIRTHIREVMKHLDPRMFSVVAIGAGEPDDYWPDGVPRVLRHWRRLPARPVSSMYGMVRSLLFIRRSIREISPKLCHAHGLAGGALAAASALTLGGSPPVVITAHNVYDAGILRRTLLLWLWSRPGVGFVAVSSAAARALRSRITLAGSGNSGSSGVCIIPNGMPESPVCAPGGRTSESEECRLLFLGRFTREKGVDVLLEACSLLMQGEWRPRRRWHLNMVGDGPLMSHVKRTIRREDLGDRVTLTAWADRVGPFLQRADLLVVPSRSEAAGLSLYEALSAGLPVVASAVGGIEEVLDEGAGWPVPPGCPEELARALGEAIDDAGTRHRRGLAAGRAAGRRPRWSEVAGRLQDLYLEMIETESE